MLTITRNHVILTIVTLNHVKIERGGSMKKIKAINGYTIYEATKRDENKYNVEEGYFYIYFSSDIRDYGISNSEWDWEAGSIEEATNWCTSSNYAIAKEIVEERTTAATYEEIEEVEALLNAGLSVEEIEEGEEIEVRGGAWLDNENRCFYDIIGATKDFNICKEISNNKIFALPR